MPVTSSLNNEWRSPTGEDTLSFADEQYTPSKKEIFKGAATTVIGQAKDEPLYRPYLQLLDGGTKPNLAKLTLARQVASIMLAVWRNQEVYDPARVGQAV